MNGSPIDDLISGVRARRPEVEIDRLTVTHPADDNNLWFFRGESGVEVQVECGPGGHGPFLIEANGVGQRAETLAVPQAVEAVIAWLG